MSTQYPVPFSFVRRNPPERTLALQDSSLGCYHGSGWLCMNCIVPLIASRGLVPNPPEQRDIQRIEKLFSALLLAADTEDLRLAVGQRNLGKGDVRQIISTDSFLNANLSRLDRLAGIGAWSKQIALNLQEALSFSVMSQNNVYGVDIHRDMDHLSDSDIERFRYRSRGRRSR